MDLSSSAFKLQDRFIEKFKGRQPEWGPVGYIVYKRTYSRAVESLSKRLQKLAKDSGLTDSEEFWLTLVRVVEGTYRIQESHCKNLRLPWNPRKAQKSAQEMYRLMWEMKFLPPGRGLWMMGTEYVEGKGSAPLNNCAFASTRNLKTSFSDPFCFLMDMSMLGIGVGGDTKGAGTVVIKKPRVSQDVHVIEDSREGWVDIARRTLEAYVGSDTLPAEIDDSKVRKAGELIKGFGGVASGPGPLLELIQNIQDILNPLIGEPITSTAIVDLYNVVGRCVVSGNVRRSAEILFGDIEDPDFLDLKNKKMWPEENEHHRWASNNSIAAKVGMDYSEIAKRITENGEPGLFWLENARAYSRMKDPADNKDNAVAGANPCVTADTWVATDKGYYQVKDLVGKSDLKLKVNGELWKSKSAGFWHTGKKPIFRLTTSEGYSLKLTFDHKVLTRTRGWVEVRHLNHGEEIVLNNHRTPTDETILPNLEFKEGFLLGLLVGDGTFAKDQAVLSVWDPELCESVIDAASHLNKRSDFKGFGHIEDRNEFRLKLVAITNLAKNKDITQGNKTITDLVLGSSDQFVRGFLRGLFDSDGTVIGSQQKGVSVRLCQNDYEMLQKTQQLLLRFGIKSSIYKNRREAGEYELPDGQGGYKLYTCKAVHELVISNEDMFFFQKDIGFASPSKATRLTTALDNYKRKPNRTKFSARYEELEYLGEEDVYDVTVETVHAFDANGLYVHNCVEQSLEDREICCLVETFPSRIDSYEEYERTLKYAYLYAKTVTLMPTHDERTNAVVMRNRRIGTSQSGIVQAFQLHGKAVMRNWCDLGYKYLDRLDKVYSKWMCVPESIKKTSIKPSGSVSKLPGVTPGIHYDHSEFYMQVIRFASDSKFLPALIKAGYATYKLKEPNTTAVYFPIRSKNFDRGKADVSMWEQLENAAMYQAWWADNQVSVTVSFKPEEASQIKHALEHYETRLKGVSFLPLTTHGYEHAPLQTITEAEYEEAIKHLKPLDLSSTRNEVQERFCDGEVCELPVS